jgi:hypothetical protein
MDAKKVLRETFGFGYFYTNQQSIVSTLVTGKTDVFCCAPRNSGVKTAIISQAISSGEKCIFIIRSIAEIDALLKVLSVNCKVKALSVTSHLALSERLSVFKSFFKDDTLFLITTPDQFRNLNDHASLFLHCPTPLLITMFDCDRAFPESFNHHASYSDSINLIHSLQTTLECANQTRAKLTALLVSECLSQEHFLFFHNPLRPPAKFIHSQHRFGDVQMFCSVVSEPSLDAIFSKHIEVEPKNVAFICSKHSSCESTITSVLTLLNKTKTKQVFEQAQLQDAVASSKPFIFICNNLHSATLIDCQKIIHVGIPENTSHLTFLLSNTSNLIELHYLYTLDDVKMLNESVAHRYPEASSLVTLIDYLCEQPVSAIVSKKQLLEQGKSSKVEALATYRFIDWMLALGYLKKVKEERAQNKGKRNGTNNCLFQVSLLPNKDFLVDLAAKRHARAKKRATDTLNLMFSSKCKQVAFNELNGDPELALACGHCAICKPPLSNQHVTPPKKAPVTDSQRELMRFKLITLRNSSGINSSLPASLLLPDPAIEQILEKWPSSINELKQLDSFKNNSRHLLFGDKIIEMLTSSN